MKTITISKDPLRHSSDRLIHPSCRCRPVSLSTAQRRVTVTLIDDAAVALAVTRREPVNAATGLESNVPVVLYFNKSVDPARLQLSVKQTAHGLTWDLTGEQGASPIMDSNTFKLVQVDIDQQPVAGGRSTLPGGRSLAFYPAQDFVYGATVFVDVSLDRQMLDRFSSQVRPLPTLVQGFVADSLRQPLVGIEVSLPDLDRRAVANTRLKPSRACAPVAALIPRSQSMISMRLKP